MAETARVLMVDWPTDRHVVIVVDAGRPKNEVDALIVPILHTDGQPRDAVVGGWSALLQAGAPVKIDMQDAVAAVRKQLRALGPSSTGNVAGWVLANFGGTWSLGCLAVTGLRDLRVEAVDLRGGPPQRNVSDSP